MKCEMCGRLDSEEAICLSCMDYVASNVSEDQLKTCAECGQPSEEQDGYCAKCWVKVLPPVACVVCNAPNSEGFCDQCEAKAAAEVSETPLPF